MEPTNDRDTVADSVAVVVPVYRDRLRPEEHVSLVHLEAHLGRYDRIFLAPESLSFERRGYGRVHFADEYFVSVDSYSRLLLSKSFYRAFEAYRHILIYQLDSLVFSDRLADWCSRDYDFVGAPWLRDPDRPELGFSRVGNGGFSLRNVPGCLRVLEAGVENMTWRRLLGAPTPDVPWHHWGKRLRVWSEARRGVTAYTGAYSLNEDRFWSDRASLFDPSFRVAPVEEALDFAFERAPRTCFARNANHLPFGCHAWAKWDPSFWQPHLLQRVSS